MRLLPLCKCGCGKQVEKRRRKYYGDHYKSLRFKKHNHKKVIKKIIVKKELTIEERRKLRLKNSSKHLSYLR